MKILAWPIAFGAGIFYGHRHARNAIYNDLNNQGEFDGLRESLKQGYENLKTGVTDYTVQGRLGRVNREYEKGVTSILHQRGYRFTHQYVADLSLTHKFETGAIAISAASVALGVALTIADSKLIEKLARRNPPPNQAQREI